MCKSVICPCAGPAPTVVLHGHARLAGLHDLPAVCHETPPCSRRIGLPPAHGTPRIGSTGVSSLARLVSRGHAGEAGQAGPALCVTEARNMPASAATHSKADKGASAPRPSPAQPSPPAEDRSNELRDVWWEASLSNFSESFPAPPLLPAATSLPSLVGGARAQLWGASLLGKWLVLRVKIVPQQGLLGRRLQHGPRRRAHMPARAPASLSGANEDMVRRHSRHHLDHLTPLHNDACSASVVESQAHWTGVGRSI